MSFNTLIASATNHWMFQETTGTSFVDSAGGISATLQGGRTAANLTETGPAAAPWYPNSVHLDGTNDYFTLASAVTAMTADGASAIVSWIKLDGPPTGASALCSDSSPDDFYFFSNNTPARHRFATAANGTTTFTDAAPSHDTWYMVTLTKGTDDVWHAFLDGTEASVTRSANEGFVVEEIGRRAGAIIAFSEFDGSFAGLQFIPQELSSSDVSDLLAGPLLENSVSPALSSSNYVIGAPATTTDGTWILPSPFSALSNDTNGAPVFTYQWQRDTGGGFANISGQTASSYSTSGDDDGASIRCAVTATNDAGGAVAFSNEATVGPPAARVGQTLTIDPGTWGLPAPFADLTNGTITFTYQWQRSNSDISGATSASYTLIGADLGLLVRCVITATNDGGSTTHTSFAVGPILPAGVPLTTDLGQVAALQLNDGLPSVPFCGNEPFRISDQQVLLGGFPQSEFFSPPADIEWMGDITYIRDLSMAKAY